MTDYLFSAATIGLAIAFIALYIWCRAGRSARSRWWVRRGPARLEHGPTTERVVLLVIPMSTPLFLTFGIFSIPGLRSTAFLAPFVIAMAWGLFLMVTAGWRIVLPLWLYPRWLREERRRERDALRRR